MHSTRAAWPSRPKVGRATFDGLYLERLLFTNLVAGLRGIDDPSTLVTAATFHKSIPYV